MERVPARIGRGGDRVIVDLRPDVKLRVCLVCGAVVAAGISDGHEDWHTAISGVAIEQTNLIDQLRRQIVALRGGPA